MAKRKSKKNKSNILGKLLAFLIFVFASLIIFIGINMANNENAGIVKKPAQKVEVAKPNTTEFDNIANLVGQIRRQLGVSDNLYTQYIKEDGIHIYIGIDKQKLDLTYSNMILHQELEKYNAELLTGWESNSGKSQQIEVIDPNDAKKYFIRVYYAEKEEYENTAPKLALIIDDFGNISKKMTDKFCHETDPAVTFAIIPGRARSVYTMKKAIATKHETMIHMPMEPGSYPKNDPGDNAIFVDMNEKEIRKKVVAYIKELPDCVGANNHMGSLVTSDEYIISIVLDELKKYNLYFVDSKTTGTSEAYKVAQKLGIPSFERNYFLDDPAADKKTRDRRISQIKEKFKKRERVVVIAHCFSQKHLDNINKFVEAAKEIGFEVVPVSAFYKYDIPLIR